MAPCSTFRHRACIVGAPQPPRLCDRQVVCRCNRQPTRKLSSHQIPGSTNLLAVKSSSLSHNLTSCVASGRDACHTLPRPLTLVLCKLANRFTAQRWTGWTKERSCSRIGRTISPSKRTGRPCRCVRLRPVRSTLSQDAFCTVTADQGAPGTTRNSLMKAVDVVLLIIINSCQCYCSCYCHCYYCYHCNGFFNYRTTGPRRTHSAHGSQCPLRLGSRA